MESRILKEKREAFCGWPRMLPFFQEECVSDEPSGSKPANTLGIGRFGILMVPVA